MKKTPKTSNSREETRREYRFDYTKARGNRFAPQFGNNATAIVLEPDVAKVFRTSHEVNRLLRSVISAVPQPAQKVSKRKPRRNAD